MTQYTPPATSVIPRAPGWYGGTSQPYNPQPEQGKLPGTLSDLSTLPFRNVDYILRDSNPVKYPKPVVSRQPQPTTTPSNGGFPAMPGGSQQQGGGLGGSGGYILGSSAGPPAGYGAGLTPATQLGGGLWPSLVGLYK